MSPLSSLIAISAIATLPIARALSFTPAPPANLDLSQLGSVGIAGDFSGISLYQYEGQNEKPYKTDGSAGVLARLPNGAFTTVVQTDGAIKSMCSFQLQDGSMQGVVFGGSFTSLAGMESTAIALLNSTSGAITPLAGLSGTVNAIFCDQSASTVYVGGSFKGANSTNAIAWVGNTGWTNLPFAGFNGPVNSITKAANGHIIFGGEFTGLGNASTPNQRDQQVINLSTAQVTAGSSIATPGFSDPRNIICKASGADGAGNTWLLQDNTPGFWQATFGFGFEPTKLRLYNTRQDGRGTKTFRFTALPINGIMNFTYIDAAGRNASCTSECPLPQESKTGFTDFHFVNRVGMNAFRVDISAFYGAGGGLNGIELFQDGIFSYAVNSFNSPNCSSPSSTSSGGSSATATGPWRESESLNSQSRFLTATLQAPITPSSASVVFAPDIKASGNYSVDIYTPGCLQDNSCQTRGQVNITVSMVPGRPPTSVQLYQTNNYDKYDQIYFGAVDASSGFRPTVTMTPLAGQQLTTMTFVAQRVGFTLLNSTGGLNGLYEYDPSAPEINPSNFATSTFNKLGSTFASRSAVEALVTTGDITYIAGNFTSTEYRNIVAVSSKDSKPVALDGGLNGGVKSMFLNGSNLYVGGEFTGTQSGAANGLSNVAVYDTTKNTWTPLGAGVNGRVNAVVPLTMNITGSTPEVVISVSGSFKELAAFGDNPSVSTDGFGIWVPSQGNWLRNLKISTEAVAGVLSTAILNVPGAEALYAGSVSSSVLSANGAVALQNSVTKFPVRIQATTSQSTSVAKRDIASGNGTSGVVTGLFDQGNGRNMTILAGHFTATGANSTTIRNLVIIDGRNKDALSGLGPGLSENSTFVALAVHADSLFAGGNVAGTVGGSTVSGLVSWNLATNAYNPQPPALMGGNNTVTSITVRPNTGDIYVGGTFASAGSLGCPGVCRFSTEMSQWSRPGSNLGGVVSAMMWTGDNTLVAGGRLTVNSTVPATLVRYDAGRDTWDTYPGSDALPGPVTCLTAGSSDGSQLWVSGNTANGSVYLSKFDGQTWTPAGIPLGSDTEVRSIQIFSLGANHENTPIIDGGQVLMLTGSINIPNYGTASAAIYNGTTLNPYALTSSTGNEAGTISRIFVQNPGNFFSVPSPSRLPLVAIVLIGLAIALGLMLLIVAIGLLLDRLRKKREGYVPAPTSMYDRGSGMQRIPPHQLLESLRQGRDVGAPRV